MVFDGGKLPMKAKIEDSREKLVVVLVIVGIGWKN